MSSHRDNCEDWIIRAKRGGLSESEQRQFRELLAASIEARLLYEASCVFDRESCVMPGDDARLERMARQLQKRHWRRRRWVPIRSLSFGVVAAILVAGAAVGAVNYSRSLRIALGRTRVATAVASQKARAAQRPVVKSDLPAPTPVPDSSERVEPKQVPLSQGVQSSGTAQHLPTTIATTDGAQGDLEPSLLRSNRATGRFDDVAELPASSTTPLTLFVEANRARVQGATARAVAQYERLLSEFPLSREAWAARISIGMLYLQQGHPRQALQQFQAYQSNAGPLAAEALWGEAQALRVLGQGQDERRALERIVRDYPQSAYVPAAQSRLSE